MTQGGSSAQRETQLKQARLRIQNADAEKEMITRYAGAYQELARIGFAGEEQRINWLDGLRSANEQARTFGVEYDIGAQRPYRRGRVRCRASSVARVAHAGPSALAA